MKIIVALILIAGWLLCKAELAIGSAVSRGGDDGRISMGHHYQRDMVFNGMWGP